MKAKDKGKLLKNMNVETKKLTYIIPEQKKSLQDERSVTTV